MIARVLGVAVLLVLLRIVVGYDNRALVGVVAWVVVAVWAWRRAR